MICDVPPLRASAPVDLIPPKMGAECVNDILLYTNSMHGTYHSLLAVLSCGISIGSGMNRRRGRARHHQINRLDLCTWGGSALAERDSLCTTVREPDSECCCQ